MKNLLPISVVIPTMNRAKSLTRTITCLVENNYIPNQIVVIDQSEDEISKTQNHNILMEYNKHIDCRYIYQKEPSLTKARNKGIEYCHNEIIVFSDDDVDVNNDTILNVYKMMEDQSIVMIAGLDEKVVTSYSKLGYLFYHKSYKNRNIGHVTKSIFGRFPMYLQDETDTQWAMGFFFVIRKSLLVRWGVKWDENLTGYAYAEDLDFSYSYYKKAKSEGKKCLMNEKVKVKHLVSQDYRIPSKINTAMYIINREYLSYKHFPSYPISRLATRWANLGEFLYRIIKRSAPGDIIKAQILCDIHRQEIKQGQLCHIINRLK